MLKSFTALLPLIEWGFVSLGAIIAFYINIRLFMRNQSSFNTKIKSDVDTLKDNMTKAGLKSEEEYKKIEKEIAARDAKMNDFIESMREFKSDIKISMQELKSKINHGIDSFNNTNSGIRQLLESQEEDIKKLEKEQKEMFKEIREDLKSKQDK